MQLFAVYSKKVYFYTQFQWIFLEDSYTTNDILLMIPNFLPIKTIKHTPKPRYCKKVSQYLQPPEWINISVQYLTSSQSDCYVSYIHTWKATAQHWNASSSAKSTKAYTAISITLQQCDVAYLTNLTNQSMKHILYNIHNPHLEGTEDNRLSRSTLPVVKEDAYTFSPIQHKKARQDKKFF